MAPVIEVLGLTKRYGGRTVVDDVSFCVEAGEVFALLGPNGAGKTTTVEIVEGLRRPDAGQVRVLGHEPRRGRRHLAQRIGVMPQEAGFYPTLRPPEALRLFAAFYDRPANPDELLERVGLAAARGTPWRRLSTGERQRLSLALALVGHPELVFLDEPTAGMDAHARRLTWELIRSLRDEGTTILLTTHLLDEAERLAGRVGILHRGRLVACGPPERLGGAREVRFRAPPRLDVSSLGEALGAAVEEAAPGDYRVLAQPAPELLARLTAWMAQRGVLLSALQVGRSLEDVFLELTSP